MLRRMGEMLGDLNSMPAGKGAVAREAGSLHHYSSDDGYPRKEVDAALSWLDEVAKRVTGPNKTQFQALREQTESADDAKGLPQALVHPDPVPKNFILTTSGPIMVDWTGAGTGPRLYPLAVLILSSSLSHDSPGWSKESVDAVVEGYRSRVALSENELERLAAVMRVRPLLFACWRYRHAMLSGKHPDGKEWWWPDDQLVESIATRAVEKFGQKR